MSDINMKLCRICLKNEMEALLLNSSCYRNFFTEILDAKNLPSNIFLCSWCKTALKHTTELLALARESQKVLLLYDNLKISNIQTCNKTLFNFSQNSFNFDMTTQNDSSNNNDKQEILETNNGITIEDRDEGINFKKVGKREMYYNEMKFDVEYLTEDKQKTEIDIKKSSEKYKSMKYHCVNCGIGFLTKELLDDHAIRHLETTGPHECKICYIRFKSQDVLSQHSLSHKRRFTCRVCNAAFTRWSRCVTHRLKCGIIPSFVACSECSKVFGDKYSLEVHIKSVHKKEKKYVCEHCDKRFASKQRLTSHIRTHTGVKPFQCEHCERMFASNSNLRAHNIVHENHKRHYCVECNKYYKTEKSLKRHFGESSRHVALETLIYKCKECSKQFSTEKLLNSHINVKHLTEYRCPVCTKTFSNNANLKKHIRCIHVSR